MPHESRVTRREAWKKAFSLVHFDADGFQRPRRESLLVSVMRVIFAGSLLVGWAYLGPTTHAASASSAILAITR